MSAEPTVAKMARYRSGLRAQGLRPVQFWVPDTRAEGYGERLARQCRALRHDPAEARAIEWAQANLMAVEGWE
jgi:hypothetical protein